MEVLDDRLLERAVHPLGLSVRPRVIRFCELVDDAVFIADPAKDGHTQKGVEGFFRLLGRSANAMP